MRRVSMHFDNMLISSDLENGVLSKGTGKYPLDSQT